MINPWTSRMDVIDIVNELFDLTTVLVEAPSGDSENASVKKLPKSQLPELASCLFKCIQERLYWLGRYGVSTHRQRHFSDATTVLVPPGRLVLKGTDRNLTNGLSSFALRSWRHSVNDNWIVNIWARHTEHTFS